MAAAPGGGMGQAGGGAGGGAGLWRGQWWGRPAGVSAWAVVVIVCTTLKHWKMCGVLSYRKIDRKFGGGARWLGDAQALAAAQAGTRAKARANFGNFGLRPVCTVQVFFSFSLCIIIMANLITTISIIYSALIAY